MKMGEGRRVTKKWFVCIMISTGCEGGSKNLFADEEAIETGTGSPASRQSSILRTYSLMKKRLRQKEKGIPVIQDPLRTYSLMKKRLRLFFAAQLRRKDWA